MQNDTDQPQTVEHPPEGEQRTNPQADPGGNYPDAGRPAPPAEDAPTAAPRETAPSGDHFGQDGDRHTLDAGESQRELGDAAEQSEPAMDQNNASVVEKLQGIVEQTVADSAFQPRDRLAEHLRQRILDSGLQVDDAAFATALRAVERALPPEA